MLGQLISQLGAFVIILIGLTEFIIAASDIAHGLKWHWLFPGTVKACLHLVRVQLVRLLNLVYPMVDV